MESAARYHLLQNEAEEEEMEPMAASQNNTPDVYAHSTQLSEENTQNSVSTTFNSIHVQDDAIKAATETPPDYHVATDLPSYEDVERAKLNEERRKIQEEADLLATESALLGTDFLFLTSFFVSFLFNWMGFLLVLCFCHTVAGRYGALAGFGLSLSKWMLIVKHSTNLMSHENDWLWWLVIAFGILICVRASLQYIRAKREWRHLSSNAQERLFYFY